MSDARDRDQHRPGPRTAMAVLVAAAVLVLPLAVAIALAAVAAGCGGGGAPEPATVAEAWAVPVGDGTTAAVYATVTAAGADELTGGDVTSDVARRVEVVNPDDEAEDEPGHLGHLDPGGSLQDDHSHTVELPGGRPVRLEPGGAHLTLDLLAEPLEPGDTFELTLTFGEGPDVPTEVTVRPPEDGAAG